MLDPDELYEYVFEAGAKVPEGVLLHTFDGFIDAGHAARGVAKHLRDHLEYRVIAQFDTDQLVDYRERRPMITFSKGHFSEYERPSLEVLQFFTPAGESFLVLDGREPALQWERFAAAVIEIIDYLDVNLTIGLGGAPMPVPHTRPMSLIAHSNSDGVIELPDLIGQEVEFPASAAAVLEMRLGEAGCPAIGFVAQVPHYAAGTVYPQATLALLRRVTDVTGLDIPLEGLQDRVTEVLQSIELQLENNPEGRAVVNQLEERYDEYAGGEARDALALAVDLPSGDEIGAEFQRFLAGAGGPVAPTRPELRIPDFIVDAGPAYPGWGAAESTGSDVVASDARPAPDEATDEASVSDAVAEQPDAAPEATPDAPPVVEGDPAQ